MTVGNAEAIAALAQVKSNVDPGLFRPLQEAAVQALSLPQEWIDERNAVYQERLEIILDGLTAAGMEATHPRASLWARIPAGWASSEAFALALERTGIAVAPGSFFGPAGEGIVSPSFRKSERRV